MNLKHFKNISSKVDENQHNRYLYKTQPCYLSCFVLILFLVIQIIKTTR